jgi:hypothetical protein
MSRILLTAQAGNVAVVHCSFLPFLSISFQLDCAYVPFLSQATAHIKVKMNGIIDGNITVKE